ncbi:septum formation protein [Geomicrobium halophilum]|uniref:dTTP/UTP pyrophosphatase n=1 Tax=Geomicrobium halophilum TaxID=549000 RepID=A0A841PM94_9BACL|nr:Maf family protein [Geomicrobium halophilum]MBB6448346.1 septum formation protein [Geomicrobium halophilum]
MSEPALILASASPRRQHLLQKMGYNYSVDISHTNESLQKDVTPRENVIQLAERKAEEVQKRHPHEVILAADTIVSQNKMPLGKPLDKTDALRILTQLSGDSHQVYTGVCIKYVDQLRTFSNKTNVHFHPLSSETIQAYVETSEPLDKAGAYGIQDKGGLFVSRIEGDYFNIVGLPMAMVARALEEFEIYPQWLKKE